MEVNVLHTLLLVTLIQSERKAQGLILIEQGLKTIEDIPISSQDDIKMNEDCSYHATPST